MALPVSQPPGFPPLFFCHPKFLLWQHLSQFLVICLFESWFICCLSLYFIIFFIYYCTLSTWRSSHLICWMTDGMNKWMDEWVNSSGLIRLNHIKLLLFNHLQPTKTATACFDLIFTIWEIYLHLRKITLYLYIIKGIRSHLLVQAHLTRWEPIQYLQKCNTREVHITVLDSFVMKPSSGVQWPTQGQCCSWFRLYTCVFTYTSKF